MKDIEGNTLNIGDEVYYARKRDYTANGEMIISIIADINYMDSIVILKSNDRFGYRSTSPKDQLLLRRRKDEIK